MQGADGCEVPQRGPDLRERKQSDGAERRLRGVPIESQGSDGKACDWRRPEAGRDYWPAHQPITAREGTCNINQISYQIIHRYIDALVGDSKN